MAKSNGGSKAAARSRRNLSKEREWRGVIAEQREGEESVRGFCRKRGLHETSFYFWRREIDLRDREAASGPKAGPMLAPVVVVEEPGDDSKDRASEPIEIILDGGTTVRVPADSTREHLVTVLSVLEQVGC